MTGPKKSKVDWLHGEVAGWKFNFKCLYIMNIIKCDILVVWLQSNIYKSHWIIENSESWSHDKVEERCGFLYQDVVFQVVALINVLSFAINRYLLREYMENITQAIMIMHIVYHVYLIIKA